MTLEIIVQSLEDARAAAAGGADRLEIVRDIRVGGLTPSVTLVRAIAAEVGVPLRVMIRENAGYDTDPAELVRMCRAASAFAALDIDGLVVGFARAGQLLPNVLCEVLHAAPVLPATFHRAFDALDDPLRAIDALAEIPQIDRILTDGMAAHTGAAGDRRGPGLSAPAAARCVRLREYADRAGSRLTIIAGSGVDEALLQEIVCTRCVREVHIGRAAREGGEQEGPVTAARVRRLRQMLNRLPESPELP